MNTFETYQAAKIAMPKACIVKYKYGGNYRFTGMPTREGTTLCDGSEFAEPQDHCMTVKQFLENGHKFIEGDLMIDRGGLVIKVSSRPSYNKLLEDDDKRYVLRAKVLEETNTIPTETQEEKEALDAIEKTYRYEKVTDSIFDLKEEFERGELYFAWLDNHEPGSNSVGYDQITDEKMLLCRYEEKRLLRRIEVTERELFIDAYASELGLHIEMAEAAAGKLYDSGKFKLVNGKG